MNLARAGQLGYQTALDLSGYLRLQGETDLLAWDAVVATFDYISQQLYHDPDFTLWQASPDSVCQSISHSVFDRRKINRITSGQSNLTKRSHCRRTWTVQW